MEEDEHFHVTAEMLDEATQKWCFAFDIENSIVILIIFHVILGSFALGSMLILRKHEILSNGR